MFVHMTLKKQVCENFFSNFSDRTRLQIILALYEQDLSVNEIASKIKEEQSNVSHHLKKLTKCGIVTFRVEWKKRIYSLNKNIVMPLLNLVSEHMKKNCHKNCTRDCLRCVSG